MPRNKEEILKLASKKGNDADLFLLDKINELMEAVKLLKKEAEKKPQTDEEKVEKISLKLATKLAILEKGEKGDKDDKGDTGRGLDGRNGKDGKNGLDGKNGKDGKDGKNGKDGKDANQEEIIEKIENDLPTLATKLRDALELLQGEERLDVKAIGGLEDLIKKLDKKIDDKPMGGGGGFSYIHMDRHIIDDETPSGTVNGTNKAFVLANTPNPSASLKVFVNGQKMTLTEDYTFSGRTITFVTAPPTTSVVRVDYRIT